MKKVIFFLIFSVFIGSSYGQTIVWKQLASIPEGYYSGEAVTLNKEIYFVTGRNDTAATPDLKEIYFTAHRKGESSSVYFSKLLDKKWINPKKTKSK